MVGFVNAFVRINEIMYSPSSSQGSDNFNEWIEIFNNGTTSVDLTDATLCGDSLSKGFVNRSDANVRLNTSFILEPSKFALITDGGSGTSVYENFSVDLDALAFHVSGSTMCNSGLGDGEKINITLSTESHVVDYTPFVALFPDTDNQGKTLIFYKGNFTESALINGTPGASNDQFAPDFNKWVNPSKNNSLIGGLLNITVNITDVTNVSSALIDFNNSNFSMSQNNDLWYFVWNTSLNADASYNIIISFNDTLGFSNSDTLFDVTVDNTKPSISNPTTQTNSRNFISPGFVFNATVDATDTNLLNVTCSLSGITVGNFSVNGNVHTCNLTAPSTEDDFEITFTAIDKAGNENATTTNFTTKHTTSASLTPSDITITDLNTSDKIVNIDATLTNDGANIIFDPGIRLTGLSSTFPGSILIDYAACNEANLTAGQSCTVPLNVTVLGASTGTFSAFWNANWTNSNFTIQSLDQSVSSTLTISDNPVITTTPNINITIDHGTEKNISFQVNSTGNVDLSNVVVTYVAGNLTAGQVSFISPTSLATVSSKNATVNVTINIPTATSPGTYVGKLSVTADSTATKETDIFVDVPQDTTWTSSPSVTEIFRKITDSGTAATITINNSGNVDMDFSISYSGNMFEFLMLPPVTVVNSMSVSKDSANSFDIGHNANGPLTVYDLTVTMVNDLTVESNISTVKLTQDDDNPNVNITNPLNNSFVKGVVEFKVNATDLNLSRIVYFINDSLVFNSTEINFTFKWDTLNGSYSDDIYPLKVIAFDSSGNSNSTGTINVTVDNEDNDPILLSEIPTINVIEDNDSTILNLSLFFKTIDEDSLNYTFTEPANVIVEVNNETQIANFSPATDFFGTNFIVFTAVDSSLNTTESNNIAISVANLNDAPTVPALTSPEDGSNVTSSAGKATLRWSTSVDADNDPITYYVFISNDSNDIRFNATTFSIELQLTNLDSKTTYFWNVLANDSLLNSSKSTTFNFTMIRDNDPVINFWNWSNTVTNSSTDTSPEVAENKTLSFKINASDPDNDPINFTWFVDNVNASNVQNFTFNLTNNFTAVGNYVIKLKVQDNNSNFVEQEWQVTVTNTNREPKLDSIGNRIAEEDSTLKFNITALDLDGDGLIFTSNLSSISFTNAANNSLATVSWTPTNDDVGSNVITFVVNDTNKTASETIEITVTNTNDAPTIISFSPVENTTIAVNVGSQRFEVTFADIDIGDYVNATWFRNTTDNIALKIAANSSNVTVTNLDEGIYNITVIVNDTAGLEARNEWILTVTADIISDELTSNVLDLSDEDRKTATSVTVSHPSLGNINFGDEVLDFSGVVKLEDAFNISKGLISVDTTNFPALNKPAELIINGLSFTKPPLINISPDFESTSNSILCLSSICNNLTYDVENGILKFNVTQFSTFFPVTNTTNGAPQITSIPVTTTVERAKYTYDVDATDPDGDVLFFSLLTSPSGMSISSSTGLISWTPTATQIGVNNVTVNVSDGSLSVNQTYNITVAEGPKLQISDLDVKVDGKTDKNLIDGDKISKEAKPGSKVIFNIEVENLFTDDEDLEIEDIEIIVTILDIDDGDDLDEDAKEFDLKAGKDEREKIEFEIPLEVEEDTFDVLIEVEGDDENGTTHEIEFNLELEIEKENHEIRIIRSAIRPSTIKCQRTISINTEIINTGTDDEDDVTLEVISSQLGISSLTLEIELDEGTDDNRFSKLVTSFVSRDILPGTYPITINTYYDGKLSETDTVNLDVEECELVKEIKEKVKKEKPKVQVIKPKIILEKKPIPPAAVSFTETEGYNILLAIFIVLFIGTLVFVVGAGFILLRK